MRTFFENKDAISHDKTLPKRVVGTTDTTSCCSGHQVSSEVLTLNENDSKSSTHKFQKGTGWEVPFLASLSDEGVENNLMFNSGTDGSVGTWTKNMNLKFTEMLVLSKLKRIKRHSYSKNKINMEE